MSRYLIEVPHGDDKMECQHSVEIFQSTGNHFLVNADWGCLDGVHKAWFMADAESKEELIRILPPAFRHDAKIIQLNKFRPSDSEELLKHHSE